jgi:1-acyl-sn-glycerol-3-phosphate acyltransferase
VDDISENLSSLEYINLRGNEINEPKKLKKLHSLQKLKALVLVDNPMSSNDDYRLEVLIAVRRLERLDKDKFSEEERSEAEEIYEQRRQKELEETNNPTIEDMNEQQAGDAEAND